jgi:hypothetical protein
MYNNRIRVYKLELLTFFEFSLQYPLQNLLWTLKNNIDNSKIKFFIKICGKNKRTG